ncbi:PEP-CTERM sorting domain-containing protein [Aeoliella sp. SH292]|uniref:PEP-CTERM sorting domain-containing protein n=1 Tax=Aeoliella sp. SH292 TaxID=3454464 RepID=UPI003F9E09CC
MHGNYLAVLRNDASHTQQSRKSIGDFPSVDTFGSAHLANEQSDEELSSQFAVKGTGQEFGVQLSVDAGQRANDSMAWATLELSVQDNISILDENGAPLDLRRRPPLEALVFHVSFGGTVSFRPADSPLTDQSGQSLVVGDVQVSFSPGSSGYNQQQQLSLSTRDIPLGLPPDSEHTLNVGQLLTPSSLAQLLGGSRLRYQWRFSARTLASSGAISIDAPDFFRIDAITFRDGTTPESHGFSLRFQSGLPSPNLRVPEPSTVVLLIGSVLATYGIRRYRAVAHAFAG